MKSRTKLLTGIVSIMLSVVLFFITVVTVSNTSNKSMQVSANSRTIELTEAAMDAQSILDEFDDAVLITEGSTTYFEGYKSFNLNAISEIDYISDVDYEELEECTVKYNFSYDYESNIVTIAAAATLPDGSIEIDEISGVGFINDNGEIDAVMNIDGEGILLSEMRDAGMIENCGWFSKLIKAVVSIAVTAVVVAAVAAVVVATAGAAAPALVAVGAGVAGSTTVAVGSAAAGVAAGALFVTTIGQATVQAGVKAGESLGNILESTLEQIKNKVKAKIDELSKLKQYKGQQFIIRAGNYTNLNFTPKDKDLNSEIDYGLSFFKDISALLIALPSTTKVCITTVDLVEQTGYLYVMNDHGDHMAVRPSLGISAFKSWINSRVTAETNPHEYTILLKNTIIAVV